MYIKTALYQIEQDLKNLAHEHDSAANNEYIWSMGASDAETLKMHAENMKQYRQLARMYRKMSEHASALFEVYADDIN